jgi:hypothetical protein
MILLFHFGGDLITLRKSECFHKNKRWQAGKSSHARHEVRIAMVGPRFLRWSLHDRNVVLDPSRFRVPHFTVSDLSVFADEAAVTLPQKSATRRVVRPGKAGGMLDKGGSGQVTPNPLPVGIYKANREANVIVRILGKR